MLAFYAGGYCPKQRGSRVLRSPKGGEYGARIPDDDERHGDRADGDHLHRQQCCTRNHSPVRSRKVATPRDRLLVVAVSREQQQTAGAIPADLMTNHLAVADMMKHLKTLGFFPEAGRSQEVPHI